MIKLDEVAFIKTTGESVFVLGFNPSDPAEVMVRRPIAGRDGVRHEKEFFLVAELESVDEQRARFIAEQEKVMEKYGPKIDASLPSTNPDNGFSSN